MTPAERIVRDHTGHYLCAVGVLCPMCERMVEEIENLVDTGTRDLEEVKGNFATQTRIDGERIEKAESALAALRQEREEMEEPAAFDARLADLTREVMAEINACTPGTRLAEVPTLFAFGPIERAIRLAEQRGRAALQQQLAALTEARDMAHSYLSRLLVHVAPQCEPEPSLLGLCTQIDNGFAGLSAQVHTLTEARDGLRADLELVRKALRDRSQQFHRAERERTSTFAGSHGQRMCRVYDNWEDCPTPPCPTDRKLLTTTAALLASSEG